jgi:hypothetical protein
MALLARSDFGEAALRDIAHSAMLAFDARDGAEGDAPFAAVEPVEAHL